MSKTVYKVMLICALVLILPLAVVGSVLVITTANDINLAVYAYVDNDEALNNAEIGAYVKVLIDGKETTKVSKNKSDNVTYSVQVNGYNFEGWYAGDYEDYKADSKASFISTDPTITFKSYQYPEVVAVCSIVKYEVSYSEDLQVEGVNSANFKTTYNYGELLDNTLTGLRGTSYDFMGWSVNDNLENVYTRALFPVNETVVLYPVWDKTYTIKYYQEDSNGADAQIGETVYFTERKLNNNQVSLMTLEELNLYGSFEPSAGYEFAWSLSKDLEQPAEITTAANYNVYLFQTPLTYNVEINPDGGRFVGGSDIANPNGNNVALSYNGKPANKDGDKYVKVEEALKYYVNTYWTKDNYRLVGFEYNEQVYTSNALFDAIVEVHPNGSETTVQVSLAWEYIYSNISIENVEFLSNNGLGSVYDEEGQVVEETGVKCDLEGFNNKLADIGKIGTGLKYSDKNQEKEIRLSRIEVNGVILAANDVANWTFTDLVAYLAEFAKGTGEENTKIQAIFDGENINITEMVLYFA